MTKLEKHIKNKVREIFFSFSDTSHSCVTSSIMLLDFLLEYTIFQGVNPLFPPQLPIKITIQTITLENVLLDEHAQTLSAYLMIQSVSGICLSIADNHDDLFLFYFFFKSKDLNRNICNEHFSPIKTSSSNGKPANLTVWVSCLFRIGKCGRRNLSPLTGEYHIISHYDNWLMNLIFLTIIFSASKFSKTSTSLRLTTRMEGCTPEMSMRLYLYFRCSMWQWIARSGVICFFTTNWSTSWIFPNFFISLALIFFGSMPRSIPMMRPSVKSLWPISSLDEILSLLKVTLICIRVCSHIPHVICTFFRRLFREYHAFQWVAR